MRLCVSNPRHLCNLYFVNAPVAQDSKSWLNFFNVFLCIVEGIGVYPGNLGTIGGSASNSEFGALLNRLVFERNL